MANTTGPDCGTDMQEREDGYRSSRVQPGKRTLNVKTKEGGGSLQLLIV